MVINNKQSNRGSCTPKTKALPHQAEQVQAVLRLPQPEVILRISDTHWVRFTNVGIHFGSLFQQVPLCLSWGGGLPSGRAGSVIIASLCQGFC